MGCIEIVKPELRDHVTATIIGPSEALKVHLATCLSDRTTAMRRQSSIIGQTLQRLSLHVWLPDNKGLTDDRLIIVLFCHPAVICQAYSRYREIYTLSSDITVWRKSSGIANNLVIHLTNAGNFTLSPL